MDLSPRVLECPLSRPPCFFSQQLSFSAVLCLLPFFSCKEAASPSPVKSRTDASARLLSPPLPGRAQSVASLGSQCSYSSTIVHVGDKKLPPELGTRAASGASAGAVRL